MKDKTKLADAKDELTGLMRRVRGLPPEKKDDFSINEQQAFKSTLDPVKNSIAIAGIVHHRPFAFRRRDRHHEYHIRQRERTNEGNRDTQSTRRAPAHDPAAVPDRIDCALSPRWIYRSRVCLRDVLSELEKRFHLFRFISRSDSCSRA